MVHLLRDESALAASVTHVPTRRSHHLVPRAPDASCGGDSAQHFRSLQAPTILGQSRPPPSGSSGSAPTAGAASTARPRRAPIAASPDGVRRYAATKLRLKLPHLRGSDAISLITSGEWGQDRQITLFTLLFKSRSAAIPTSLPHLALGIDDDQRECVRTPRHSIGDADVYLRWQQNRRIRGQLSPCPALSRSSGALSSCHADVTHHEARRAVHDETGKLLRRGEERTRSTRMLAGSLDKRARPE